MDFPRITTNDVAFIVTTMTTPFAVMTEVEIAALVGIGILAAALGVALGRYVWPAARGVNPDLLADAKTEIDRLTHECTILRNNALQLNADYKSATAEAKSAGEDIARLSERVAGLLRQIEDQTKAINELQNQRDEIAKEAKASATDLARLKEREVSLSEKIEAQTFQLTNQQKQLTVEFENIANRILKANAIELSENSQKALTAIVDPLRERIQDFQRKVETTHEAESQQVLLLQQQIKSIVDTSTSIGNQADGLAKALRGDSQLRGRWGELALERILEAAGLTQGIEYITQGRGLGLKGEDGKPQRPDVIVMLPDKRVMIVDSKVSLTGYERLNAAKDDTDIAICTDQLLQDVRDHINDLGNKRYQYNERLVAHDCVLMFVPIEGALAAALRKEPELFMYAWKLRVVLTGPSTLLMTMRTIDSIWSYERRNQNAQEIARLAGDLCDKLSLSLADLNGVAEKINTALNAHNEALKRLFTGRGNALSIGERLRTLGAKAKGPMPPALIDGISVYEDDCSA
jgi:DNA recombination protein RmuC